MKEYKTQFDIKIIRQHWINDNGKDDKNDLCSHGEIYLRIGNEELSNKETGTWTLSSTALYLMRTVNDNYEIGDFGSQLIPCCGHFFMEDEKTKTVAIIGCPNGIDWTIKHLDNNQIQHISQKGEIAIINKEDYKKLTLEFVNQVEQFYQKSEPKKIPEDESDRKAYKAFWNEWTSLKINL